MENIDNLLREIQSTENGRQFLGARRVHLFRELHEMVFYGKGGYDWETVYHLPIWLRRFVYSEIVKHYRDEKAAVDRASQGKGSQTLSKADSNPTVRKPDFTLKPRK